MLALSSGYMQALAVGLWCVGWSSADEGSGVGGPGAGSGVRGPGAGSGGRGPGAGAGRASHAQSVTFPTSLPLNTSPPKVYNTL